MPERPTTSPVLALLTIGSVWESRLSATLKDLGLTARKYGLLAHIHATPGISFSELARLSHITVQTAHTAVRALQDEGLVHDATAHAGAASDLRATPAGEAALAEAEDRLTRLDGAFVAEAPQLAAVLEVRHEEPAQASGTEHSFS
ncbi:MarR family winged helix-turn-helix transcriptional regulator [Microbacterium immunditiarum]|uniref:DNA-binding MarR family transcriptional regulator n=1 Tax=Microbacterium immunditiarum TaxID=337480 RepID=A0A7Y9GNT4_9MICO|nr:helix-turn-helix domain-containing protein [Microbacterium immunditiarum]NYE19706.1 DNA-binding MarR family transcriptional regulator [Microbacterium immunditiarum]